MIHCCNVAVIVEGAFLWQAGSVWQYGIHWAEGVQPHAVDTGIMFGQFAAHVIARVITLI